LLLLSEELSKFEYEDDEETRELESDEKLDACVLLLLSDELCTLEQNKELESEEVSEIALLKLELRLLDSE
jgi:hypothetical protein